MDTRSVPRLTIVGIGLAPDCTQTEIRGAYLRESLKHHPDKVRPDDCNAPELKLKPRVL